MSVLGEEMIETAEEFVRLRTSDVEEEYYRAAHEPASLHVWLEVIAKYPDMRFWVAHNKTVPLEILDILAKDGDSKVRSMVASKNKLTPKLLEQLSRDDHESVRQTVACHRKVSIPVLERLTKDPQIIVATVASEKLSKREVT